MKNLLSMLVAVALAGCYATVGEDGRRGGGEPAFTLSLPAVLPPLVVVQPGVSVARDMDDEVFFADGYYWARQDQDLVPRARPPPRLGPRRGPLRPSADRAVSAWALPALPRGRPPAERSGTREARQA